MSKNGFYFPHDYNARNDRKLVRLRQKHGIVGVGIYWCVIEMLYEEGGYLLLSDCEGIAEELKIEKSTLEDIVNNSGLFNKKNGKIFSKTALKRLKVRRMKSELARQSADTRWERERKMRTQSERNAKAMLIKNSKEKKSKVNKESIKKETLEDFNLTPEFKELLIKLRELPSWEGLISEDIAWLRELRSYWPNISVEDIIACRDWNLDNRKEHSRAQWKNRIRNWMLHKFPPISKNRTGEMRSIGEILGKK